MRTVTQSPPPRGGVGEQVRQEDLPPLPHLAARPTNTHPVETPPVRVSDSARTGRGYPLVGVFSGNANMWINWHHLRYQRTER